MTRKQGKEHSNGGRGGASTCNTANTLTEDMIRKAAARLMGEKLDQMQEDAMLGIVEGEYEVIQEPVALLQKPATTPQEWGRIGGAISGRRQLEQKGYEYFENIGRKGWAAACKKLGHLPGVQFPHQRRRSVQGKENKE